MITFILNNNLIKTDKNAGMALIDFIRNEENFHGTKIGCREGDCGACTVLEGVLKNGEVIYRSIVSCLTPLANVHGKHIVTIEGINSEDGTLSPVQQAIVDNAATQCGFCTPGFVMSFTGHCMSKQKSTVEDAIASVAGNICRCTGYQSIKKAAQAISDSMQNKDICRPVEWMVSKGYLPPYFVQIPKMLASIEPFQESSNQGAVIAGGTDLMVRSADALSDAVIIPVSQKPSFSGIRIENRKCIIGSTTTVAELRNSAVIHDILPGIQKQLALVSSMQIQNTATIAGNIVNASPIGGLSIIMLALNANISIINANEHRTLPLREFFLGYKQIDLKQGDLIESFDFAIPNGQYLFNFEKVSKRIHLDIASINSAMLVTYNNNRITDCSISAGGVAPIPFYLKNTSAYFIGKTISDETIAQANLILQSEIQPIADIRGSVEYKRQLIQNIITAHFNRLNDKLKESH